MIKLKIEIYKNNLMDFKKLIKKCSSESKAKHFKIRSFNNNEPSPNSYKNSSQNIFNKLTEHNNSLNNINSSKSMKIYSKPKVRPFITKQRSYINKKNLDTYSNTNNNFKNLSNNKSLENFETCFSKNIISPYICKEINPLKNENDYFVKNIFPLSESKDNKKVIKEIFINTNLINSNKNLRKNIEQEYKCFCLDNADKSENNKINIEKKNKLVIEQRQPIYIDFNKKKENSIITIKIKIKDNKENENTIKPINQKNGTEESKKRSKKIKNENKHKTLENSPKYNNIKNRNNKHINLDIIDKNYLKTLNNIDKKHLKKKNLTDVSNFNINNSFNNTKGKLGIIPVNFNQNNKITEIGKNDIEQPNLLNKNSNKIKNINKTKINKNLLIPKTNSERKIWNIKKYFEKIPLIKIDINNIILSSKNKQALDITRHKITNKDIAKMHHFNKTENNTNHHSALKEKINKSTKNICSLKNNSRNKNDKMPKKYEVINIQKNNLKINNNELKGNKLSNTKSKKSEDDKKRISVEKTRINKRKVDLIINRMKKKLKTIEVESSKHSFLKKYKK